MKRDPNSRSRYEFDENGLNEVSEQIRNAYNLGFIDQGTAIATEQDFIETENI